MNSPLSFPHDNDSAAFATLFAKAKSGSKEQQAELLNSFRDYLRALATKAIGPETNGKMSVSDLVQSAIIDACNGFAQCRAERRDEFKAWLRQILMNDIRNRYRYLRRQKRDIGKEVGISSAGVTTSEHNSPVAEAQRKEDELHLLAAISQLPADYGEVIRLRHRDKLSFVEIGERMNRSADAVRMLANRAVEELSKVLASSDLNSQE